ncbi:SH2 domain-containing adapter protein D-like isoform X2 [Scleropages formosus]|uniref:Src homology 2 domain containing transforming protein D n=1 Tax=Scleropages formosus TaxID=113540 RepID=A0A8C9VL52_SCLFO|nr:SH2 domain-containing adapter protein D-like isoform X2 [Scleropages formosus]
MAKWLRDYLSFGTRRAPPQPPKPDYSEGESELLRAYRAQKNLDFEDPYVDQGARLANGSLAPSAGTSLRASGPDGKAVSPKHRLIKIDSQELVRSKILLSAVSFQDPPEPVVPSAPLARDADYSDPFDARPERRSARSDREVVLPENNGYMEPYEAQRVITELQRGTGGRHAKSRAQLYDTPYEDRARGRSLGRDSRLPREDERPADEYDQPWEWKKENISKAFAVQFDGPDWEQPSAPPERPQPTRTAPAMGGAARLRKHTDPHLLLGERVDPTLPLEKQVYVPLAPPPDCTAVPSRFTVCLRCISHPRWYHGALSRSEAESLLTLCKECSYLVRNSQTNRSDYSLSLRSCQGFMHMKFSLSKEGKYILGENSPPFGSIPEAVHYYTTHRLPIRGAEHLSLLFPVLVQTL